MRRLVFALLTLSLGACQAPVAPASPGPEGWLPILDKDPTLALSHDETAHERGFTSDNPKVFTVLPSGALRAASTEAGSLRRDIDTLLLTTPYLTWRWRLEPGPLTGVARLHLAVGFKTGGTENRLIVAWGDNPANVGRLERRGNAAYFIAQGGTGDNNWREATLDIAELHRLAWPDTNTLYTRITYVALFVPETKGGPAVEIERLALIR